MLSLSPLRNLWGMLQENAQATGESETADPDADEATADGETPDGADLTPDPIVLDPVGVTVPMTAEEKSADPIDAISETAESAGEAASELVNWVGSGQREALFAVGLTIAFFILMRVLRWLVLGGVRRLPHEDEYTVSEVAARMIRRFHSYFMLAVALVLTDWIMELPTAVSSFVHFFFVLAIVLQFAEWVQEFTVSWISRNLHRGSGDARALASAFNVIKWFITFGIWAVALLLILDNVGADVTTLLAGLGIGGIAIGIAAQGVFRDLFSSLSIVIDKPFQVGDMVRYGESWGAIEDIGLKSTRVRARSGEQLIISNTNLLDLEIHNMARMVRRRVETGFGVIYQTNPDIADAIPDIVQGLVKKVPGVEFERCGMSSFGSSSLDYSLTFYSLHPDYNRSMTALSRVLLALYRGFKEQGIEFAYPTQTLYIEGVDDVPQKALVRTLKDEN
ncbi:MAG: mechanosensitive ion channel family protein [Pseudomonadota bacterium]